MRRKKVSNHSPSSQGHLETNAQSSPNDLSHGLSQFKDYFNNYSFSNILLYIDWPTVAMLIGLIIFGLFMVFSSTMYLGKIQAGSGPLQATFTQSISIVIGFFLCIVVFLIPTSWYKNPKYILFANLLVISLLLLTRIIGITSGGARSWLSLGPMSIQPSEFSKIVAVITWIWIADYSHREFRISRELFYNFPSMQQFIVASSILSLILIALQPDFGMLIIITLAISLMWLIDHASKQTNMKVYAALIVLFGVLRVAASNFSEQLLQTNIHFFERIGIFMNPFIDQTNTGYQSVNAYVAFSRGGLFGVGIGQGLMKRGQIPAIHNDFILANIGEEIGFIGVLLLLLTYFCLFFRLLKWSAICQNPFRSRMITGLTIIIMIQTLVNIGGVMGLIPMTGVTLPLISAGGSSMIITIVTFAIILKMIYEEQMLKAKIAEKKGSKK